MCETYKIVRLPTFAESRAKAVEFADMLDAIVKGRWTKSDVIEAYIAGYMESRGK